MGRREENTNLGGVIRGSKNQLWSSVVARANVGYVGLVLHQDLRGTEVTQFEHTCAGIEEQILRLDIPMTDPLRMNVGERPEQLIDV